MAVNGEPSLSISPTKRRGGASVPPPSQAVEAGRRFGKLIKPFEHVGAFGFFFFTSAALLLLLLCFFHAENAIGFVRRDSAGGGGGLGLGATGDRDLAGVGGDCDLFDGDWVWDDSYPLYNSTDCPFADSGFRCSENGRPDKFFSKWRWQPSHCDLPRFDAKKMLEKLRGHRIVFIGDSIGRNQWESLLCMLSSAVPNKSSIYEVNGNAITKHTGFLIFKFGDYNCTVEYFRSPFLVVHGRPPPGSPANVRAALRVDTIDWNSAKWRDADVLIFNTGHWWSYEKTIKGGCYFQIGKKVSMNITVGAAYQRSIKTLFDWVHKEVNMARTQVFYRTYSPVHFSGGDWKSGGSCHKETMPVLGNSRVSLKPWLNFLAPFKTLDSDRPKGRAPEMELLNVTEMTARRKDGHLSVFYYGPSARAPLYRQDCSHWCLPGVPDTWNELLYSYFMRREAIVAKQSL